MEPQIMDPFKRAVVFIGRRLWGFPRARTHVSVCADIGQFGILGGSHLVVPPWIRFKKSFGIRV